MNTRAENLFVDTSFVIALVNQHDEDHHKAIKLAKKYQHYPLITTDAILLEIENALSKRYKRETLEIITHFYTSENMARLHEDNRGKV